MGTLVFVFGGVGNDENRCGDCSAWCGRCRLGKVNRIAWSFACDLFERGGVEKNERRRVEFNEKNLLHR